MNSNRVRWRPLILTRSAIWAWIGFMLSAGMTFFLWQDADRDAYRDANVSFEAVTDDLTRDIDEHRVGYEQLLRGGAGLINATGVMNQKMWHDYIGSLDLATRRPGFYGIGIAGVVEGPKLAAHIRQMRAEGRGHYTVWPSGPRPVYYPVICFESLDRPGPRVIGFDMGTDSVRYAVMRLAGDTGRLAMSGKTWPIDASGMHRQARIVMYVPVYGHNRPPESVTRRRAELRGFVYMTFRVDELMNKLFHRSHSGIAVAIYEGAAVPANLLYTTHHGPIRAPLFKKNVRMDIFGRTWTIVYQSLPDREAAVDHRKSRLILLAGIPISLLVFAVILSIAQLSERARRMARRMTAEIRELNKELENIIDTAPGPILLHTEGGKIAKINRAWSDRCGYTLEETPTIDAWVECVHKRENWAAVKAHIRGLYDIVGRVDEGEFTLSNKAGEPMTWQFSSAPFGRIDGKRAVITSAMDITEVKKKDAMMVLQSRHAAMGEMISMIAHQWRQPLASISAISGILSLDVMMDEYKKEFFEDRLNAITGLAMELSATINDFRNFFRDDKEKIRVTWKQIVEESARIMQPMFATHSIGFECDFRQDKAFWAYPREMRQVILNLLKNGQDVLVERAVADPHIWVRSSSEGRMSRLEIEDNGGGIADTILDKIFDPYFTTKTDDGTGIGLYMSKIIVEQHLKGRLSVRNTATGACFEIMLPCVKHPR